MSVGMSACTVSCECVMCVFCIVCFVYCMCDQYDLYEQFLLCVRRVLFKYFVSMLCVVCCGMLRVVYCVSVDV